MTNTEPAAPATGCGGMPGHPMKLSTIYVNGTYGGEYFCPGCLDCQPAPTPIGDSALAAFNEKMWGLGPTDEVEAEAISEFEAAIRAESAEALRDAQFTIRTQMEALQEACEQLSAATRELSALSSDKQTLMTAVTHWRERAEAAEARLREVEGRTGVSKRRLIYLASPYSHADPEVMEARFEAVCREAAVLMEHGLHVYSPIAHTHPIAVRGDLPKEWPYWEAYDRVMLAASTEVYVLQLEGWDASKGVSAEIEIAREMGLPVTMRAALAAFRPVPAPRHPQYGDVTASGFKYGCFDCEDDKPHTPHIPTAPMTPDDWKRVTKTVTETAARLNHITPSPAAPQEEQTNG